MIPAGTMSDYVTPLLVTALVVGCVLALGLTIDWYRRLRLADRVNQPMVVPERPLVVGPLRDAASGALLAAATGDAARRRGRSTLRYGVGPQLMLCAARSLRGDGSLARHRYRLELGYLSRYQQGADRPLRRLLRTLRSIDLDRGVQSSGTSGALLFTAFPVGIVWHDRPRHAASVARELVGTTHRAPEMRDGAALVAATTARMVQFRGEEGCEPIHGRRALLEKVFEDVGGADGAAAVAILPAADLAAVPPASARDHLKPDSESVLDVLLASFYLLFRFSTAVEGALDAARELGLNPVATGLAAGMIGARMGRSNLPSTPTEMLQHRAAFEIHGEKLAMANPAAAQSSNRGNARLLSATVVNRPVSSAGEP